VLGVEEERRLARRGDLAGRPRCRPRAVVSTLRGVTVDALDLIASDRYGDRGIPYAQWAELRRSPLQYMEPEGYESFWAITRHADIIAVSSDPATFCNGEGIVVLNSHQLRTEAEGTSAIRQMKTIIEMDPPDHRRFRKVASGFFTPRGIERLDTIVRTSAQQVVDGLGPEGEADLVAQVAQRHPLRVLSTILGIEPDQEERLLELTQQLFAADDPDLRREADSRQQAIEELGMEFFTMFNAIIEDRRAHPRDDLATMLATATLDDGEPLGMLETLGYYLIVFTAGHDTTRHALTGALDAFMDHPEELARLRDDRTLLRTAVEEVVRWSAPVNYMKRTATRDVEFGGAQIKAGERLALFYASANRDETVFDDPDRFDIGRDPNRHLGFGWAEHYCLGSHLARASITALLDQLADRVEVLERAGDASQVASAFVVGRKTLPARYVIRPAA